MSGSRRAVFRLGFETPQFAVHASTEDGPLEPPVGTWEEYHPYEWPYESRYWEATLSADEWKRLYEEWGLGRFTLVSNMGVIGSDWFDTYQVEPDFGNYVWTKRQQRDSNGRFKALEDVLVDTDLMLRVEVLAGEDPEAEVLPV